MPVWLAVVCSRLIVLVAGSMGALFGTRVYGWENYDPHRLTVSLGSVGNVLAASVLRWDGVRYVTIAEHRYTTSASTVSFPLYSLMIRGLGWIVQSPVVAGVLISLTSFAVGLTLVHRIAREEIGPRAADATVLLLAFAPLSFFFTAIYTESLFLALSVGAIYLARQQRFALACVVAAGATLTHIDGVLLIAPIAIMYQRSLRRSSARARLWSRGLLPFALPPLAIVAFFVYLHAHGWSWLAPITNQNMANYDRYTATTPVMLWKATEYGISGLWQTLHGVRPIAPTAAAPFSLAFQNVIYLMVLVIALASLVAAWRRLPKEYAIYATLAIIVCTWSATAGRPLEAFDRYMLPIFPLWMGAAAWLEERRLTSVVLKLSTTALIFYTIAFARWAFVA